MAKRWKYTGDMNLECGGIFYRDSGYADYCEAVRVTPTSDGGGPDNLYIIEIGSYFFGDWKTNERDKLRMASALQSSGMTLGDKLELIDLVHAIDGYCGVEDGAQYFVRIGPKEDERDCWIDQNECPDYILRARSSLRNFVRREFLKG